MPKHTLYIAIEGWLGKAYKVEAITIGFIIGAASINVTAAGRGTPFLISLAPTGTMEQSQTGKKNPANIATINCKAIFSRKIFVILSLDTNTCIIDETNTPNNIKGNA